MVGSTPAGHTSTVRHELSAAPLYRAPILTIYGDLAALTRRGGCTSALKDNTNGACGATKRKTR